MAIVSTFEAGLMAAPRATILQLRAPHMPVADLEREAARLVATSTVPVLVSSRCDVALTAGAAGVNLPERDIPIRDARELLGDRLVGRSVHSLEAAIAAEQNGADFLIFGPVWESSTHPETPSSGVGALARVAGAVRIAVLAIGGVNKARIAECLEAGAAGYAAIRLFN
ncbi:MAG TPA: thiamine phosphate synthase [Candidatus Dormibacteraeota bacterium]|nr:thiamine phosphate synthase [Candidatus Dormibacteraeota bacterium]